MASWFQCWSELALFDWSNTTGAIDVKMDGTVLEEKSSFKILGLNFSSKLDWGSYISSITKTASKKIRDLVCAMKFQSPEIALYLYKSELLLGIVWQATKQKCRTVGPSLSFSHEPLVRHQNVASLSFLYGHYFGRCSSELA